MTDDDTGEIRLQQLAENTEDHWSRRAFLKSPVA